MKSTAYSHLLLQVHVIQSGGSIVCFSQNFDDQHLKVIADIAQYSGGSYSLSGNGFTLKTLPLQYDSEIIHIDNRASCQGTQTTTFELDANTWTVSLSLYGESIGDPTLTGPDGKTVALQKVFAAVLDRYYSVGGNRFKIFYLIIFTL
jgi:hypothetical protein